MAEQNGNAPRNESQVAYHRRRMNELKTIRTPWESEWRSVAEFVEPSRLRLLSSREQPYSRSKILDATGTFAAKTLASGMHSGLTSPARPWFRLGTSDSQLREFGPVKEYLALVEKKMREVFQKSNIYPSFHLSYLDLGLFGQPYGLLVEDEKSVIRMQNILTGRAWIARDEAGIATTLYRQFRWSAQKIVGRFGYDNCSRAVQGAYDRANYDQMFEICHAVEPRLNRDQNKIDKKNKPFLSNYWEDQAMPSSREGQLLEESGFDSNPIICPPWELAGDDTYSISPSMMALGDIKMLQLQQTRKLEAIDKQVRPPMTGPTSMMNNPASLLPGSITYVDDPTGAGFRAAMQVNLRIDELRQDIRETQERVNRFSFADLFLMISQMEGIQPRNQFEIAERKEEKLLALGPVLENVYSGQLAPVIGRTYEILEKRGMLPPPPKEIQGQDLGIEYISILAQAQKAVATGSIERVSSFIGSLAGAKPEVLDKLDADEAVDQYAESIGAPPSMIVSDDRVKEIRAERAKQQEAAKNAEMMKEMAPAARDGAQAAQVLQQVQQQGPTGNGLMTQLGLA